MRFCDQSGEPTRNLIKALQELDVFKCLLPILLEAGSYTPAGRAQKLPPNFFGLNIKLMLTKGSHYPGYRHER